MASVLVTGGAGFIGSHIVEELLERGHDIKILDNLESGTTENISHVKDKIDFVKGSISDFDTVKKAVKNVEYIFHQAAFGSAPLSINKPLETHQINVVGTLNILAASIDSGVRRIINASSASIYGGIKENPKKETMMPVPLSPYAVSKVASEFYTEAFYHLHGLESVNLRYFNVFGPRQVPNSEYAAVIPKFIKALMNNHTPTIYGNGEQTRDFVFIKDVVNANILSMESKKTGCLKLNIACGQQTSINNLFTVLKKIMNKDVEPIYKDSRPGDPMISMADISRVKEKIGYLPKYNLEEGLKNTVDWFTSK